jgi:hypothetical protein
LLSRDSPGHVRVYLMQMRKDGLSGQSLWMIPLALLITIVLITTRAFYKGVVLSIKV